MTINKKIGAAHIFLPRNNARTCAIKTLFDQNAPAVMVSNIDFFKIQPATDEAALKQSVEKIYQADLLVLVSVNAVKQLSAVLSKWNWLLPKVPIAVMGESSKMACQQVGLQATHMPLNGNDSEALLARLDSQSWAGRRVLILRAQDGRDFLAAELAKRSAHVDIIALYERHNNPDVVTAIKRAQAKQPITHVLLSSRSVAAIWKAVLHEKAVNVKTIDVHWLCFSERIANYWQSLFPNAGVTVLADSSDTSIYAAIMQEFME